MTATETHLTLPIKPAPTDNGMTDERWQEILAYIAERKYDAGYFERWERQVAEVRQQIQEQTERELDEAEGK